MDFVKRLGSQDVQTRLDAERCLLELKAAAAEALVRATCRTPDPDQNVVDGALRILGTWERESWTSPESAAAINRFVELARDPRNWSGRDAPLSPQAQIPLANVVRVLDVTPAAAAAYLSAKPGIRVSNDGRGWYRGVRFGADWVVGPKDWLYVANLARELPGPPHSNGRFHSITIDLDCGRNGLDSDTLAECLRYLRKSLHRPFALSLGQARMNRECLIALRSYGELTELSADFASEDITDEDWATSISAWPHCVSLLLPKSAGGKAIAAASKLENLAILFLKNSELTEADLKPLREHKKLSMLLVWNAKTAGPAENPYVAYLNQQGTGRWQVGPNGANGK